MEKAGPVQLGIANLIQLTTYILHVFAWIVSAVMTRLDAAWLGKSCKVINIQHKIQPMQYLRIAIFQVSKCRYIKPIMCLQEPHHMQTQQSAPQPQLIVPAPLPRQAAQPQPLFLVGDVNGDLNALDRQQFLRHKQQRLLLLQHAAQCQHEDGRCLVTRHCASMRCLWKHIADCNNQTCLVPHCVSSRYILSHYHRCKDVRCPICGPVRKVINREHVKQKQKQMHVAAIQRKQLAIKEENQNMLEIS
jgi:E1A/CREB-binding protein